MPKVAVQDVALIVGGGPGISASCARLLAQDGMRVGIAARDPDKPVLESLERSHGIRRYRCDASEPDAVRELFEAVVRDLGAPTLVVHNIDGRVAGIFGKAITDVEPRMALETLRNAAFSALPGRPAVGTDHARQPNQCPRRERNDHLLPTQVRPSKASRQVVPSQWHVTPSPGSRRAWREN